MLSIFNAPPGLRWRIPEVKKLSLKVLKKIKTRSACKDLALNLPVHPYSFHAAIIDSDLWEKGEREKMSPA